MRNLIKSILKEEYEKEPQVGDLLLCHTVTPSFRPYLTKDKTYQIINKKFLNIWETIVIKDDTNTERMFTIKPVNDLSYKTWFHLLDNIDDEGFFETILETEEEGNNDFDWVHDVIKRPNMWETLPREAGYVLFYFYPKLSPTEFSDYVIPLLRSNNIKLDSSLGYPVDHLELHPSIRAKDADDGRIVALFGDVKYLDAYNEEEFVRELSEDSTEPINGRKYFDIP